MGVLVGIGCFAIGIWMLLHNGWIGLKRLIDLFDPASTPPRPSVAHGTGSIGPWRRCVETSLVLLVDLGSGALGLLILAWVIDLVSPVFSDFVRELRWVFG